MNTASSTHARRPGRRAVGLTLAITVPLLSTSWLTMPSSLAAPEDRPAIATSHATTTAPAEPPAEQARVPEQPRSEARPTAAPSAGPPALLPAPSPTASPADPPPTASPADPPPMAPPTGPPAAPAADPPAPPAADPPAPPAADPPAAPAGPPVGLPDVSADPPAASPAGPRAGQPADVSVARAPGDRVVVCKYVRKPHEAELLHHIIIVNEEALLGRGFAGTFPFAFSDAHFRSVAIRFAVKGEQARDVPLSQCPDHEVPPPPPGECPPPAAVSCPEEPEVPEEPEPEIPERPVAGVIDGPEGPAATPPGVDTRDTPDVVLPATGAPATLTWLTLASLLMAGLTLLLLGGHLLLRGRRRQGDAMPRSSSW